MGHPSGGRHQVPEPFASEVKKRKRHRAAPVRRRDPGPVEGEGLHQIGAGLEEVFDNGFFGHEVQGTEEQQRLVGARCRVQSG